MTLLEMSASYRDSAAAIHGRIVELRLLERAQEDPCGGRPGSWRR